MEEIALNIEELRPAPVPRKRPNVGDLVYVPDRKGCNDMFHGGLARVSEVRPRALFVDEDLNNPYVWGNIQWHQQDLWSRYGATRARVATHEEILAWTKKQTENRLAAEAKIAEAERQRWLPLKLPVVNRGLLEVPIQDDHRRTKKWAAILEVDPLSPGGFSRKWFNYGRGSVRYLVPAILQPGMVIEFAADHLSWAGNRDENRWYGYVIEVTEEYLLLQPCKNVVKAVLHAREAFPVNLIGIEPTTSPTPRERATTALQADDESIQRTG